MDSATPPGGSAGRPAWSNDFPQGYSVRDWFVPGALAALAIFMLLLPKGQSASVLATAVLFSLGLSFLALGAGAPLMEHRGPNSIRIDSAGRSVVDTYFRFEPVALGAIAFLFMSACALVVWYWDPYGSLPIHTEISDARQSMTIYQGLILLPIGLAMLASRPWRRRLVFSPEGLSYRRFGPTVFIPWDTIDSITPAQDRLLKTVAIQARPPAQLPGLERKRLPDGSTRAKLAIHGMSVEPSTIVYVIRRLTAEPDTRRLLSGEHPEDLFTGPSWESRVRMEPGQTWTPDTTAS